MSILNVFATVLSGALWASPLSADFPDGYWDREYAGGRQSLTYSLSVVVDDPVSVRPEIEAILKTSGGKMNAFTDQTSMPTGYDGGISRARPAYSWSWQMAEKDAGRIARKLIALGRLLSYNVNTPYATPYAKDLSERIEWIEKEKRLSAAALRTMPVSRALLEGKLKRLRAAMDAVKASENTAVLSIQLLREDPDAGQKKGVQP
ncbi:MAG: hypothetical protein WC969_00800 [Elusimicrobiota bacterium]|jgi:hypothetical protein